MRHPLFRRALALCLACYGLWRTGAALAQQPAAGAEKTAPARIAILGALPPLTTVADAEATDALLQREGHIVTVLTPAQLADSDAFNARLFDILVTPHADTFPAKAQENLLKFLREKGKLLCLGGPPFSRYVYEEDGQWKPREGLTHPLPDALKAVTPPILETVSPAYKLFHRGSDIAGGWYPIAHDRGIGLTGERTGRLMTVDPRGNDPIYGVEARNRQWVYLCLSGPMRGALWSVTPKAQTPGEPTFTPVAPVVRRLRQGVFLTNAGASKVCSFSEEPITLGARLVNIGPDPITVRCDLDVTGGGGMENLPSTGSHRFTLTLAPGAQEERTFTLEKLPPGEYTVQATLSLPTDKEDEEAPIRDQITEPFRVLPVPPQQPNPNAFAQARGGEFALNGRPWRPVGLNYWPRWVIGQEEQSHWVHWLAPDQYDPERVEQDLVVCERLGVNLLSVQYTRPDEAPALNDFLSRCRNHRLKANVFVANADPLHFNAEGLRALLVAARLRANDTVFALDLAWEPRIGKHAERRFLDLDWKRWIEAQYGSLAGAEKDWGVPAPREDGQVTNPTDEQVTADGPWRTLVAAYRRFLDDAISRGYRRVLATVRAHYSGLVGARTGYGGNGFPGVNAEMPYDLLSGAAHLDFLSPEGYALSGEWPEFRSSGLTTAYARWAGDGKPVFWAEYGQSVFPDTTPEKLAAQADWYDTFYRMVLDSGANGSAAWWFPGGLRVEEKSDFGLIEPNGTLRPAADRLQRHATRELPAATPNPMPNAWITLDRDGDARGYSALYARGRQEYTRLREAGKVTGVRTPGTGTTTATMPLVAVGNIPANGHNPLKYANAELWSDGANTLRMLNTGEATWTHQGPGHVELIARSGGRTLARLPLPAPVARYETIRLTLPKSLAAQARKQPILFRLAVVGRHSRTNGPDTLFFGESRAWP